MDNTNEIMIIEMIMFCSNDYAVALYYSGSFMLMWYYFMEASKIYLT